MRVLMTSDTVGGVWTYTTELVSGLLQSGCSVVLVTLGPRPDADHRAWIEEALSHWPNIFRHMPGDFSLEWMEQGCTCYETSRSFLEQCIKSFKPSLLHSNQFCYGALPLRIPKLVVAHSDVRSWSAACDAPLIPSVWLESYDRLVSEGVRGADALVAPTQWMAAEIARYYPIAREISVIHNGRSVPWVPATQKRLQAVSCGRVWDKGKNMRILEEVAGVLPVVVAGDRRSPDGDTVALMPNVALVGKLAQDEVVRLFSESAIYIATSCYEPFGLAPLEAALCGCAIVANDIDSLREVWGDNAIYYKRNDAASLRQLLKHLRDHPAALSEAAARARIHAESHYDAERMIDRYMELYAKLCGHAVARGA